MLGAHMTVNIMWLMAKDKGAIELCCLLIKRGVNHIMGINLDGLSPQTWRKWLS